MDIIFGKPLLIIVGEERYFLYKYGDLCTSKSGGWIKGYMTMNNQQAFYENDNAKVTFNSDNILINSTDTNVSQFGIRNGIDINFNLFQNLEIEYSGEHAYDKPFDGGIILPNNQVLKLTESSTTTTLGFPLNFPGSGRIIIYSRSSYVRIKSIELIEK